MPRDVMTRMDVDTGWVYHRHWRAIQRDYPQAWPFIAVAWFALLGEAWRGLDRNVTLEASWPSTLDITMQSEARDALSANGLLDKSGKIPRASWDEWVEPTLRRIRAGQKGADARWNKGAVRPHSDGNANSQPASHTSHASHTSQPRESARKRGRGNGLTRAGDVATSMGFGDHYPDGTPRPKRTDA